MNLRRIAFLAATAGCLGHIQADQNASDLSLLQGRLEKQLAEISALDGEIQNLSQRLGREGTPLPRREPERPAPPPDLVPTPPPPATPEVLTPPAPVPVVPEPAPAPPPATPPPVVAPAPADPVAPAMPVAVAVAVPEPGPVAPPMIPEAPAPIPESPPEIAAVPETPAPVELVEPEPAPEPESPAPTASGGSYTVVAGDTLSAIARKHKTSLAALQKANPGITPEKLRLGQKLVIPGSGTTAHSGSTSPAAPESPAPAPPPAALVYEVQPGDTLHGIARRAGTTVEAISRLNGITSPESLKVGAKLKLPEGSTKPVAVARETADNPRPPTPGTHVVKPGDTLSSISRETGTPIDELRRVNNLKDDTIHPGQSLKVRRGGPAAKPSPGGNSGASAPTPKPAPKPAVKPAPAQGVEMAEYTVREGESLFSIARRYFLSREELASMNALPVDVPLQAGQKLRLPAVAISATQMTESESQAN